MEQQLPVSRSLSRLVPGGLRPRRSKSHHSAAPGQQQPSPPIAKEPANDTERTRERHEEACALLRKSIKACQKRDADGLVDFDDLQESPESGNDGLLQRVNAILDERRRSIADKNTLSKCRDTIECVFTALRPFVQNALTISKDATQSIAEKEISRKKEVMDTLDYISQQLGQLKIVKRIPEDIDASDREQLTNRAIDVRSACAIYISSQLKHDRVWLGVVGKVVKTFFAGDDQMTDARTCLSKSVDRYRQSVDTMNLVMHVEGYKMNAEGLKMIREIHQSRQPVDVVPVSQSDKFKYIPQWCQRNPHFTGRESLLTNIRAKICDQSPKEFNHRLALYGMGGVGKTQIAIQYVTQFENEYESIAWITASSQKELWAGLEGIALQTGSVNPTNLQPSEIANHVVSWLYEKDNWLLVLDNVDDIEVIDGYLPRLRPGGGHVLITTRNPNTINIPAEGLEIGVHEPDEAKQLLLQRAHLTQLAISNQKIDPEAAEIVKSLGFLALAIDQAASYIREELKDIFKFRPIYAKKRRYIHYRKSPGNSYYKDTVATTWVLSVNAVKSRNPRALELLDLFAFMNPDGITVDFLVDGRNAFPDDLKTNGDEVDFTVYLNELLSELEGFSLISRLNGQIVRIHRLVQLVIQDSLSENKTGQVLTCVCEISRTAFCKGRDRRAIKYSAQISHIFREAFLSGKRPIGVDANIQRDFEDIITFSTYEMLSEVSERVRIERRSRLDDDVC